MSKNDHMETSSGGRNTARNRTPTERAIIYAGILGGLTLDQINGLLKQTQTREVPEKSYEAMKKAYFSYWLAGIGITPSEGQNKFGDEIFHPTPWGKLGVTDDVDS